MGLIPGSQKKKDERKSNKAFGFVRQSVSVQPQQWSLELGRSRGKGEKVLKMYGAGIFLAEQPGERRDLVNLGRAAGLQNQV